MYENNKTLGGVAAGQYNRTATEAGSDAVKTISPVESSIEVLCATQQVTHNLIDELERRMDVALRPSAPSPDIGKDSPVESRLCGAIVARAESATYMNNRLRDLLDRLTL